MVFPDAEKRKCSSCTRQQRKYFIAKHHLSSKNYTNGRHHHHHGEVSSCAWTQVRRFRGLSGIRWRRAWSSNHTTGQTTCLHFFWYESLRKWSVSQSVSSRNHTKCSQKVDLYFLNNAQESGSTKIVLKAMGRAINKAVTIAEILKRKLPLHQINSLTSAEMVDVYEPIEEGLDVVTSRRYVSCMLITLALSADEIDTSHPGYQPPLPEDEMHNTASDFPSSPMIPSTWPKMDHECNREFILVRKKSVLSSHEPQATYTERQTSGFCYAWMMHLP